MADKAGLYDICKLARPDQSVKKLNNSQTPLRPIYLLSVRPSPLFKTNNQAGRLAYFYSTTSPLTLFASSSQLQKAQKDVTKYEGLIRDNGKKGVWVNGEEKSLYDKAKQCELLK